MGFHCIYGYYTIQCQHLIVLRRNRLEYYPSLPRLCRLSYAHFTLRI